MSFLDEINAVNVVETSDQILIPRVGWRNGSKQGKVPGFFYIKDAELYQPPSEASGFIAEQVYDEEDGWKAETINVAFLGWRTQPMLVKKDGDRSTTIWLREWQPGATFFTEILCYIKGIDELIVWTAKGMTGKAITAKDGIIAQIRSLTQEAKKRSGKALNLWAFWAPISSKRDAKGNLVFDDTGFGSTVTLPSVDLGSPKDAMERLWVGRENYQLFADTYEEYRDNGWFKQKRGNTTTVVESNDAHHEESHDFTDDDIPF